MSFKYINKFYGKNYKRGMRILFDGEPHVITSTDGTYLKVRKDGEKKSALIHPTWRVEVIGDASVASKAWLLCRVTAYNSVNILAVFNGKPTPMDVLRFFSKRKDAEKLITNGWHYDDEFGRTDLREITLTNVGKAE